MPDLEERTIDDLPQRCESCGATLTDAEKSLALEREDSPVLCTICATEQEPSVEDPSEGPAGLE
jgi:hypothetical protein